MERIDFTSFKKYAKELENTDICVKIQMMIKTEIKIKNAKVLIENNTLTLCENCCEKAKIDLNYIANFYADKDAL